MRISWLFIYLHCGNIPWLTTFYRGTYYYVTWYVYSSYVYVRGILVGCKFETFINFTLTPISPHSVFHPNVLFILTPNSLQYQLHLNLKYTVTLISPQAQPHLNFISTVEAPVLNFILTFDNFFYKIVWNERKCWKSSLLIALVIKRSPTQPDMDGISDLTGSNQLISSAFEYSCEY